MLNETLVFHSVQYRTYKQIQSHVKIIIILYMYIKHIQIHIRFIQVIQQHYTLLNIKIERDTSYFFYTYIIDIHI